MMDWEVEVMEWEAEVMVIEVRVAVLQGMEEERSDLASEKGY